MPLMCMVQQMSKAIENAPFVALAALYKRPWVR